MKKYIFLFLIFTNIVYSDIIAHAGIGYSRGNNKDNYLTAFAGANVFMGAGLRVEYTKNFSEHSNFKKEDISRYGLFAVYQFSLLPYIDITPKIGLVKTDGEFTTLDVLKSVSKSSTKFTYGLEIDYYYNSLISFFAGYTDYGHKLNIKNIDTSKMDTSNYTVGLKIHF